MTQEQNAVRELTADELLTVSGGWETNNFGIAVHFAALVNYMCEKNGVGRPFDWTNTQPPER